MRIPEAMQPDRTPSVADAVRVKDHGGAWGIYSGPAGLFAGYTDDTGTVRQVAAAWDTVAAAEAAGHSAIDAAWDGVMNRLDATLSAAHGALRAHTS